jgi:hypothetical protein
MGSFEPSGWPASSFARLAMTSLAFMFDCVPLPVCQTTSGKWSSKLTLVDLAQFAEGQGRRFLDEAKSPDDGGREAVAADPEMLDGALSLRAPVPVGGNLDGAHAIAFKPKFHRRAPVRWGAGRVAGHIEVMPYWCPTSDRTRNTSLKDASLFLTKQATAATAQMDSSSLIIIHP